MRSRKRTESTCLETNFPYAHIQLIHDLLKHPLSHQQKMNPIMLRRDNHMEKER